MMKIKVDNAELNIYMTNGEVIGIDLSPIQLMSICGLLKLQYNENEGTVSCLSDESLKEFYSKTVGRFTDIE